MIAYFDKEKLGEFIQSFYNITGITISIYDRNYKVICAYSGAMCRFCSVVRSDSERLKKCIYSDEAALKKCSETKKKYIYQCHMGLVEVATPIIYKDEILGFILFGQITNSEGKEAVSDRLKRLGAYSDADTKRLEESLCDIRFCTDEYIASVSHIVRMAAEHIVLNEILYYRDDQEKQIELYIKTNISKKLTVDGICREFNICKTTLYNVSVKYFGCSITEYIKRCRIETAKELLGDGKTLYETAEAISISDLNYFVRFFKSRAGITPKQFQLKHERDKNKE